MRLGTSKSLVHGECTAVYNCSKTFVTDFYEELVADVKKLGARSIKKTNNAMQNKPKEQNLKRKKYISVNA